ncbi:MAG: hypothetical protein GXO08_00830 [Aquificae bacterium]|nr:hypothetical protein [Aquificota bacterium]
MEKLLLLVKALLPPLLALYFLRSSPDRLSDLLSFSVLLATFGILTELVFALLGKPLGVKPSLKALWGWTALLVLAVVGVFLYNYLKPVKVKLAVVPPEGGRISVAIGGRTYEFDEPQTVVLRTETSLRWEGGGLELRRGIYLLNGNGPLRVVLLEVVRSRRIDKVRRHLEVERRVLGTYGRGLFKVWDDPRTEVYLLERPERDRLWRLGRALVVEKVIP